jgi:hypothetical protein
LKPRTDWTAHDSRGLYSPEQLRLLGGAPNTEHRMQIYDLVSGALFLSSLAVLAAIMVLA